MKMKTTAWIVVLIAVFVGLRIGARIMKSRDHSDSYQHAEQIAQKLVAEAALKQYVVGRWEGDNGTLILSSDGTFRESLSVVIADAENKPPYSFSLSYITCGRWSLSANHLTQEITELSGLQLSDIQIAPAARLSAAAQEPFIRAFRRELPDSVARNLKSELIGQAFTSTAAMPSSDTLVLEASSEARRFRRVTRETPPAATSCAA